MEVLSTTLHAVRLVSTTADSMLLGREEHYSELRDIVRARLRVSDRVPPMIYSDEFTGAMVFLIWCGFYVVWTKYMNVLSSVCLGVWTVPTAINLFHSQINRPDRPGTWTRYCVDVLGPSTDVWRYHQKAQYHQHTNSEQGSDVHNGVPILRFHATQDYR